VSEALARAYRFCARLAASHYENFPVASRLLPASMRPHIAAVYAFARVADDIADEGDAPAHERQARLNAWQAHLHAAVEAAVRGVPDETAPGRDALPDALIFAALGETIRSLQLPVSLFDDLLSAFRQDTVIVRYASWSELFDYCRRSANPIGRLVLRIGGYDDRRLGSASDALCTGLQLTNFWQDLRRDWERGRVYVPCDVLARHGASEGELEAARLPPAWAGALNECVEVTRARLCEGRAVCDMVRGRLRYELRLTWLGGSRILDAVARDPQGLAARRPSLGASDVPRLLWQAARWRGAAA
jgi:phytoene synthase